MMILLIMMILVMIMMMVQESVKMCLNVVKRPVSALYYKINYIYITIDTSLNLLTGLFRKTKVFYKCPTGSLM